MPALGIQSIFAFEHLDGKDICQLFRAFFTQVHVQSQIVTDRRFLFNILHQLLNAEHRLNQLTTLGSEFILAFIQAVDAEKDPINMKVIFSMWPIILQVGLLNNVVIMYILLFRNYCLVHRDLCSKN